MLNKFLRNQSGLETTELAILCGLLIPGAIFVLFLIFRMVYTWWNALEFKVNG